MPLLSILGFVACSAVVREINGGGGSHAEKAREMMARADNLPEDDWIEVFRDDPRVEPGCLSIDTACLRLTARWSVNHRVGLADAANRFGMGSNRVGPVSGLYAGCIRTDSGVSRESLCIEESEERPDSYQITIQMERD
jgi:hypothetical protein